jgi:hypothetical protein
MRSTRDWITRARRLLGCIALLTLATAAQAHKASDAYLTLSVDGHHIEQRLDIALRDLDRELVLDTNNDGALQWGEVRTRWAAIEALADAGLRIQADGQDCTRQQRGPAQLDSHSDGRHVVLTQQWLCAAPVQSLSLDYRLFARSDATHRGVVRVVSTPPGDATPLTRTAVLVPGAPPQTLSLQGADSGPSSWLGFVAEGIHHILIGYDHILFLLALLLPSVMVRTPQGWVGAPALKPVLLDVLRIVTAFTVAHSITLALAVLDIVNPPSRWVESIIAASVVLAALNNLWPTVQHRRWLITGSFGLVHGFGFAGALKDLGLGAGSLAGPLVGFNLGVEIGQLAIVALFIPVAWALRPTAAYRQAALGFGSLAIGALALVWLAERALDLQLTMWI